MADHGFWNYAQRDPEKLALVTPDGRHWTRGELLALCNRIVAGLRGPGSSAVTRWRSIRRTAPSSSPSGWHAPSRASTWCR